MSEGKRLTAENLNQVQNDNRKDNHKIVDNDYDDNDKVSSFTIQTRKKTDYVMIMMMHKFHMTMMMTMTMRIYDSS